MKTLGTLLLFFSLLCMVSCTNSTDNNNNNNNNNNNSSNSPESSVKRLSYSITSVYPHDTSSFTQGLAFYKDQLIEGTGYEGKSKLMHIDIKTGKPLKAVPLDNTFFGEGVTVIHDTIYQLTWKNNIVLVYSAQDLKKIKEFPLNTDGWGLANDGKNLIVSDGSSNLYFYEPSTFRLLRTQSVTEDGSPVSNINELEYINGYIYANQWQYNYILKIDPNSGIVVAKMDLTELVNRVQAKIPGIDTGTVATLNGIAFDPQTNKIYVTGKYWPELYEIQFEH